MRKIQRNSGFTLLEVILSIAILSIVSLSLLSAFQGGIVTIFSMGQKTSKLAKAQELIDNETYHTLVEYANYSSMISTSYNPALDINGRYCIETNIISPQIGSLTTGGYDVVTIMMFIRNGSDFITLSAYIP